MSMSEVDFTTMFGMADDDDGEGFGTAPSARYIDPRDAPQPSPGPAVIDPPSEAQGDVRPVVPVRIIEPVPTIPGFGRIIDATTVTLAAGEGPRQIGLAPSRVQGQQRIAYLMIHVVTEAEAVDIAGDESALPSQRFRVENQGGQGSTGLPPITLPHVAGVYVWNASAANPVEVTALVVGV